MRRHIESSPGVRHAIIDLMRGNAHFIQPAT
jgi:hypothetical protein